MSARRKFLTIALVLASVLLAADLLYFLAFAAAFLFFPGPDSASVGIIGGADGPTAIVVASTTDIWLWLTGGSVLLALVIVLALLRRRCR